MTFWKWSKTAASNATADSTVNYAEGQAPSTLNDSARAAMAALAKFRDDVSGSLTTGGSSTAYTVNPSNQVFDTLAHMDKAILCIVPHATSGAAPTLNVDGLGAKAINISTGVAVPTGALVLGSPYLVIYLNATTEFIFVGALGALGALGSLEVVSTDAAAAAGPVIDTYRNSASPAVSDVIGVYDYYGKDSGGNKTLYARLLTTITDPTDGSEDASWSLQVVIAGTLTTVLNGTAVGADVVGTLAATGAVSGASFKAASNPTALPGKAMTIQTFTSGTGATYSIVAGTTSLRFRVWGGGAGGGASSPGASGTDGNATTLVVSSVSYVANGGTKGGGSAGTTSVAGGAGGTGGSGSASLRITGSPGGSTTNVANSNGGAGGNAPFLNGGGGTTLTGTTGVTAVANSGGGGSGGGGIAAVAGGSGGGSGEYFELIVAAPSGLTITYTVGATAAGGTGGSANGGAGAAGRIIVEEYYN